MNSFPFALYDTFTDVAFGGSQAAVVTNATDINSAQRQRNPGLISEDQYGLQNSALPVDPGMVKISAR